MATDPIEKRWLQINIAVWLVIWALLFAEGFLHDFRLGGNVAWEFGLLTTGVGAGIITLFVIGIPMRVAMNLIVKNRRMQCLKETVVCIVAFAILCWVWYTCVKFPPEG